MAKTEAEIAGMGQAGGVAVEVIDRPEIEVSGVVEVGSVKPGIIPTFLEGKVLRRIHQYLSSDIRNEQGGFVVFSVGENPVSEGNAPRVARVVDFIPSSLGQKTGISFQWDTDDFSEAHRYVDKNWPGYMLGFIHSHPGMSVGPTGEPLDSFILKEYCREPFIPFLIYDPTSGTINDLRWDTNKNQAVSVGGILIDQAGLNGEMGLEFVDTDLFGVPGPSYKATLEPFGKSLEELIEISETVPAAKGEEIARTAREEERRRVEEKKSWQEVALEMKGNPFAKIGYERTGNEVVAAAAFEFRAEIGNKTMSEEVFVAMMQEINTIAKTYEAKLGRPKEQKLPWPQMVEDMGRSNIAGTAFNSTGSRIVAAAAYRFRQGISRIQDEGVQFKAMMREINGAVGKYRVGS